MPADKRYCFFLPLVGFFLLAMVFLAYPELDLIAAGFFYEDGQAFAGGQQLLWVVLYEAVPWATRLLVGGGVLLILAQWLWKPLAARLPAFLRVSALLYLLLAMALGPGLLVNAIFKEHSGRARPSQITEFGGSKSFTPAWVVADQCEGNCSFVSGHASIGFFPIAFAWLTPAWRRRWLVVGTVLGCAVGAARMAQGGHFLSDVLFAGGTVYFSSLLAWYLVFGLKQKD